MIVYHFKSELLRELQAGLSARDIAAVTNGLKAKMEAFEQQQASSAVKSSEAVKYSREVKDRLRIVSLTGGQIYKKICNKLKDKTSLHK